MSTRTQMYLVLPEDLKAVVGGTHKRGLQHLA